MEEMKLRTLSVLVDNEAGVLSQISRLFSRKGFNVESLAVGTTDHPEISRMTIEGPRPLREAAGAQPFHSPRAGAV